MPVRQTIARNAAYLFASNFLVRFITACATILLARYLGAESYGALSVALAWAAIAGYFTDMGLTQTLIREGTKPSPDLPNLMGGAFKLRLLFAAGTTAACGLFIVVLYPDPLLRGTVALVVIPTIWGGAMQGIGAAYFQMTQQMQYIALIRIVSGLCTAAVLGIGILWHWPLHVVALAYGVSSLLGGGLSVMLTLRRVPYCWGWHRGLLEGLGHFTLGGLLIMILPQLGPLVLERVAGLQQVGYFAAASRFPSVLYQIPGVLAAAFYPQLFHYGARDMKLHLRLSVRELKCMSLLATGMALPFALYAEWVVRYLLGPRWVGVASTTLAILAWIVILQGINYPLADALTTQGLQARRSRVLLLAAAIGVGCYAWWGARWGAPGAAMAAVAVEMTLLIGCAVANPSGWPLLRRGVFGGWRALGIPAVFVIALRYCLPWQGIGVVITPLLYFAGALLLDEEARHYVREWIVRQQTRTTRQMAAPVGAEE
ncbi:MAG TPA: flippase [Armatimonadota bacterium]